MAEEKKIIDPTLAGFMKLWRKPTQRKSPMKCWLGYLKTPAEARVLM
jgi:hypothetical protein